MRRLYPLITAVFVPIILLLTTESLASRGWLYRERPDASSGELDAIRAFSPALRPLTGLWREIKSEKSPDGSVHASDEDSPGSVVYFHPPFIRFLLCVATIASTIANAALFIRCLELWRVFMTWTLIVSEWVHVSSLSIVIAWFLAKVLPLPANTFFTQGFYSALAALILSAGIACLRTYDVLTRRTRWGGAHLKDRLGLSEVRMQLILIETILVGYIILAALIFGAVEGWEFDAAVYYCVVTFTTIGFGDIVPKSIFGQILVPVLGSAGIVIFAIVIWATREVFLESIAINLAGQFSVLLGATVDDVGGDYVESMRAPPHLLGFNRRKGPRYGQYGSLSPQKDVEGHNHTSFWGTPAIDASGLRQRRASTVAIKGPKAISPASNLKRLVTSNVAELADGSASDEGSPDIISERTPLLLKRADSRSSVISNISSFYEGATEFLGRLSPPPMPPSAAFFASSMAPPVMAYWKEPSVHSPSHSRQGSLSATTSPNTSPLSRPLEITIEEEDTSSVTEIETGSAPAVVMNFGGRYATDPEVSSEKNLEKRSATFSSRYSPDRSDTPGSTKASTKGVHFDVPEESPTKAMATTSSEPYITSPNGAATSTTNDFPIARARRAMSIDQGSLALGIDPLGFPKSPPARRNPRKIRLSRSRFLPEVTIVTDSDLPQKDIEELTRRALDRQILWAIVMFAIHLTGFGLLFSSMEGWRPDESWARGWIQGIYFCFVTLATIGYGDFVPKTVQSRTLVIAYIFLGAPNLTFLGSVLAERILNQWRVHVKSMEEIDRLYSNRKSRKQKKQNKQSGLSSSGSTIGTSKADPHTAEASSDSVRAPIGTAERSLAHPSPRRSNNKQFELPKVLIPTAPYEVPHGTLASPSVESPAERTPRAGDAGYWRAIDQVTGAEEGPSQSSPYERTGQHQHSSDGSEDEDDESGESDSDEGESVDREPHNHTRQTSESTTALRQKML
ncbi:hypothetical protein M427DRAFT_55721 [Gonapodya prolifera JEL478]|uniref:Potassium channel domain-containing protein n=1 Tax=Gonapodya prolifera (strain JEL478) TaxID=1344416 RepID=A0A139AHW7_GONPJ|nr:hypothetical protein M427DRAFT_55721 [Gonapodya prolifera JEL478]|eukprot:KXS16289.1 hypothetical protein M427DRAFT_55721 [Gonapodya prolifera JEL478]